MESATLNNDKFNEVLQHAHIAPIPFYTQYESTASYSPEPTYYRLGMGPVHHFTSYLFNKYYASDESIPDDYIMGIDNSSTFALGPKFGANQWYALLSRNGVLLTWVLLLLLIIIIVPFLGVFYFCIGCFRCPKTCPQCARRFKSGERLCYSILLMLLIVGIILGLIIAFLNDKLIGNRLRNSSENILRSREDTCAFLKDVCAHVNHIFVNNYEELDTHLNAALMGSVGHITMDLTSASGLQLMSELHRILDNMPAALRIMRQVEKSQLGLVFKASQYRDGMRGAKRDLLYIYTVLCDYKACNQFLKKSTILLMDTSKCLHIDNLPNTTEFISEMERIIAKQYKQMPKLWHERWNDAEKQIQDDIKPVIPPLVEKIHWLGFELRMQAKKICNKTDVLMNNIYLRNEKLTTHFEELDDHFGTTRMVINVIVFVCIFTIVLTLIAAVFCGLCVRRDNSGSICLIIAIFMIFMVLSFITLIGLFYFMLGLVTYPACFLRDSRGKNTLFHLLNKTEPWNQTKMACRANQSIIEVLHETDLYDIENLRTAYAGMLPAPTYKIENFKSEMRFIDPIEKNTIQNMHQSYLGTFNSSVYTKKLCTRFAPVQIKLLMGIIDQFSEKFFRLDAGEFMKRRFNVALNNVYKVNLDIAKYQALDSKLANDIKNIRSYVRQIDELITLRNQTFGETVERLLESISKAELFVNSHSGEFSEKLINIISESAVEHVEEFINYAINETRNNVGHCRPLAYIYDHNTDVICHQLINPINGFWVGILICALLLLPVLFVAHRLICLYRVYAPAGAGIVTQGDNNCPTCTGAPYQPPPIVVCTNDPFWTNTDAGKNKSD